MEEFDAGWAIGPDGRKHQAAQLFGAGTGPWWRGMTDVDLATVAAIMRTVDAYAFDYAKQGKAAPTRADVEQEIAAAIRG